MQPRARRLMKEALIYWRKYEKVEREQRKRAEKEALEQRKRDDEMREVGGLQLDTSAMHYYSPYRQNDSNAS